MNAPAGKERTATVLYSRASVAADSVSDEARSVDVIVSTDALDAHGTIIKQNWRLERYAANNIVLFAHDDCAIPIGLATNVRVESGQLRATLTFSTEDLNPQAEQVWKNVRAKTLRGISIGFMPHSITVETHDDVPVVVFDDNELFEISVVPTPSNAETLAQVRQRALGAAEPTLPTADTSASKTTAPSAPERPIMSENFTQALIRALGLPLGASESDIIARATTAHECESQVVTLTGVQTTGEAVGAVRALTAAGTENKKLREENDKIRGERDAQNFETQLQRGISERKLSPETARLYRERFEKAAGEGRGAEVVDDLKGFVAVAPTLVAPRVQQPKRDASSSAALEWNGKSYRNLTYRERAALSRESTELYRAMKAEWEEAGSPAREGSAA